MCLTVGALGLGAVEAHAAPFSLAGETFTSQEVSGSSVTGTCPLPPGGDGSFKFSVSGTAAGPFPGTFTESGSFDTAPSGFLNDFSSTFAITSASGMVTGSQHLVPNTTNEVSCTNLGTATVVSSSNLATTYAATLKGGQGNGGFATVSILALLGQGSVRFSKNFGSAGAVQLPTSKQQCEDGGWQSFGTVFKNQGDCISFVATGGKNPARGS